MFFDLLDYWLMGIQKSEFIIYCDWLILYRRFLDIYIPDTSNLKKSNWQQCSLKIFFDLYKVNSFLSKDNIVINFLMIDSLKITVVNV